MKILPILLAGLLLTFIPALHADDWKALMAQGEALDQQMKTKDALAVFLQAEKLHPQDALLLSRIAKQYGESMNDTSDPTQKIALGNTALDYAQRAVEVDPGNAYAQLALAVSYGRLALLLDNRTKISYSRLVKQHADIAVRLAPDNDLCWHLLGVWEHGMADLNPFMKAIAGMIYGKLPEASNAEAVLDFQKAIALNPHRLGSHVELGKTYLSMGKKTEAKAEFIQALAMPDHQRDDPESKRIARQLLEKL